MSSVKVNFNFKFTLYFIFSLQGNIKALSGSVENNRGEEFLTIEKLGDELLNRFCADCTGLKGLV